MTSAAASGEKRTTRGKDSIGLREAVAIGIGGMVGGGIFSVLGLSVEIGGAGAYISFLFGGIVAMLTGYSYAKLALKYPSRGGTVEYINQAFGRGLLSGTLNVLLSVAYIVTLALYAFSFGAYGGALISQGSAFWRHILSTLVIVIFTVLNVMKARLVGDAEDYLVYTKLAILIFFSAVGLFQVKAGNVSPSDFKFSSIILAAAVIFIAFEGFELIANSTADLREPQRNLPRALYISIGFVTILYVIVAFVVVGSLSISQLVQDSDFALAAAARPFLGQAGFVLIAIAAIISTASAINATLYGAAKITYIMAKEDELPKELEKLIWDKPLEGLFLTASLTLLIVNVVNLENISTMASSAFLVIFGFVNLANFKLHKSTKSNRYISLLGLIGCAASFGTVFIYSAIHNRVGVFFLLGMLVVSWGVEAGYRLFRKGRLA